MAHTFILAPFNCSFGVGCVCGRKRANNSANPSQNTGLPLTGEHQLVKTYQRIGESNLPFSLPTQNTNNEQTTNEKERQAENATVLEPRLFASPWFLRLVTINGKLNLTEPWKASSGNDTMMNEIKLHPFFEKSEQKQNIEITL